MSTRTAELLMGFCTLALSLGLMWNVYSDGLNIGWVEGRGPGAGVWPFWLALGMAGASVWTLVRWVRGARRPRRRRWGGRASGPRTASPGAARSPSGAQLKSPPR